MKFTWKDLRNWWVTTAWPWLRGVSCNFVRVIVVAIDSAIVNMPAINWYAVLTLVVLAYMAENGIMDDMPNIKWLVECMVRLVEWIFGLIRTAFGWCIGILDSNTANVFDIFGLFDMITNWLKEIFAM